MRPPEFWQNPPGAPGLRARMLAPLAAFATQMTARRVARQAEVVPPVPVICIGNINLGGTGKTPVTIALAEKLSGRGHRVCIVTRGHGGSEAGPLRVDPHRHSADEVGDEALLHAAFAPTIVARDRAAGVRAVTGADVILLDDGHQNPAVAKALTLVVSSMPPAALAMVGCFRLALCESRLPQGWPALICCCPLALPNIRMSSRDSGAMQLLAPMSREDWSRWQPVWIGPVSASWLSQE